MNKNYYCFDKDAQTISGIDPIYPRQSNQPSLFHDDGLHGAKYNAVPHKPPTHYEKYIRRRIHVPWLGQGHENTFLNYTSEKNKDPLPTTYKLGPITGNHYAPTKYMIHEGFSPNNNPRKIMCILGFILVLIVLFEINLFKY